ncbi:protein Brevis radix-like 4 [Sesamum angolense]|uniref:Protein Brevis radix-like 4 n=1 Tax=Sesamum angolense TaxID=2727404 RepID=A0AAE1WP38_9LAMI|nr:protein Brevis radix-like 4 [Sesamum angolense]
MFNKWQAQRWWAENSEKVLELYNVQRLNLQAFPLPTTPRSEDDTSSKMESVEDSPVTPPLGREPLPRTLNRPTGMGAAYSSSDSLDLQSMHSRSNYDSCGVASTPKLSSISAAKTEISSMDASMRSTSSSRDADRSGEISISNASDLETEWVEQDEPGVYITIRALPDGRRELRRVRFSREKFGELHARLWWKRTEQGYISNTCDEWMLHFSLLREVRRRQLLLCRCQEGEARGGWACEEPDKEEADRKEEEARWSASNMEEADNGGHSSSSPKFAFSFTNLDNQSGFSNKPGSLPPFCDNSIHEQQRRSGKLSYDAPPILRSTSVFTKFRLFLIDVLGSRL